MKKISNRFLSQDQTSLGALALLVLLLALGGVWISQAIGKNLLLQDGVDMTDAWVDSLLKNCNEIPAIIGGAEPTAPTWEFLRHASKLGDITGTGSGIRQGNWSLIPTIRMALLRAVPSSTDHKSTSR